MLDVILAPEIVVDGWFGDGERRETAQAVIRRSLTDGIRVWQYVASLPLIRSVLSERGSPPDGRAEPFGHSAPSPCGDLFRKCQWLAALAEDATVPDGDELAARQLARAAGRLDHAVLVTRDPFLRQHCSQAISCQQFLEKTPGPAPIEFIDLRRQQDSIRCQLERAVFRVLRHGQYILGPEISELENRLATFVGAKHCVAVASGTDSLLIALMAWGVGPGDEVITVPYTWISSAEVISLLGARPVFVDIDARTFTMDANLLEKAISPKTKVIMPVSLYGQCPDMDSINAIADRYGIPVLEDAAQSFGATYHGRPSCALSLVGSTSFFPSKPLGCYGDGGALFTQDDRLADLFRQIRVHGQKRKHHHEVIGINGRLDTIQAAVLLAKLDVFDAECRQRVACAHRYSTRILERRAAWGVPDGEAARRISPPYVPAGYTSVFAQYTITSEFSEPIREYLQAHEVPSVKYYAVPLHLQPAFARLGYHPGDFPIAERVAHNGLSLPMSAGLCPSDQDRVVELIFEAIDRQL